MADGWFPLSFAIPKYFGENADDAKENARYVQTVQGLMASGQVAPGSCETQRGRNWEEPQLGRSPEKSMWNMCEIVLNIVK